MQYHLFNGVDINNKGQWVIFVYQDDKVCVETWHFHPIYGTEIRKRGFSQLPIKERIFILGTTQNDQVRQVWKHNEVSKEDAYALLLVDNL